MWSCDWIFELELWTKVPDWNRKFVTCGRFLKCTHPFKFLVVGNRSTERKSTSFGCESSSFTQRVSTGWIRKRIVTDSRPKLVDFLRIVRFPSKLKVDRVS